MNGACVFTLQRDCKGLEEALALNSNAIPAFSPANALNDQGHELEASSLALHGFVLMSPFPCLIVSSGPAPFEDGSSCCPLPQAAGHNQVKGRGAMKVPVPNPDISRVAQASIVLTIFRGAGLIRPRGRRPAFSTSGLRPAACALAARTDRSLLCGFVRSPLQGQLLAWSPMRSLTASHKGQAVSAWATGSRSRIWTMSLNNAGATCKPKASVQKRQPAAVGEVAGVRGRLQGLRQESRAASAWPGPMPATAAAVSGWAAVAPGQGEPHC